jgi:hypothetical protein
MVAAWISADTGVGPAIASGSHVKSGICADFPHAPANSRRPANARFPPTPPEAARAAAGATPPEAACTIAPMSRVPRLRAIRNVPRRKHASPIRFMTKAFCPASAGQPFSYQKPISR